MKQSLETETTKSGWNSRTLSLRSRMLIAFLGLAILGVSLLTSDELGAFFKETKQTTNYLLPTLIQVLIAAPTVYGA